jgi:hypothetical protein
MPHSNSRYPHKRDRKSIVSTEVVAIASNVAYVVSKKHPNVEVLLTESMEKNDSSTARPGDMVQCPVPG